MRMIAAVIAFFIVVGMPQVSFATQEADVSVEPPQVVYLHTEFYPSKRSALENCLGRELVRQAFLIAIRDEFGIAALDGTLNETVPENAEVVHLAVLCRQYGKGGWTVKLFAFDSEDKTHNTQGLWKSKAVWQKTFRCNPERPLWYSSAVPLFESASRDVFLDALHSVGVKARPLSTKGESPDRFKEWEKSLFTPDMITQFGVVRDVHQSIYLRGESSQALSLLVRSYAQLSILTKHQFNAATEVFAARAMLYSQRMLATTGESDVAFFSHAYAFALAGLPSVALEDLEQIHQKQLAQRRQAGSESSADKANTDNDEAENKAKAQPMVLADVPVWAQTIQPICYWNADALKAVAAKNKELREWALLFWFLQIDEFRDVNQTYDAFSKVQPVVPASYGIYADLSKYGSLREIRRAGPMAPAATKKYLPSSLAKLTGLPDSIADVLSAAAGGEPKLPKEMADPDPHDAFSAVPRFAVSELRKAANQLVADRCSWSALAYLIEEEQFVQAANYMQNVACGTESSLDNQVDNLLVLLGDHPYVAFIESYKYEDRPNREKLKTCFKSFALKDSRKSMDGMLAQIFRLLYSVGDDRGRKLWLSPSGNLTTHSLLQMNMYNSPEYKLAGKKSGADIANAYLALSPHSEIGWRMKIQAAISPKKEQLQQWEKRLKGDPVAFEAIGNHYRKQKLFGDAIRCYTKAIELNPATQASLELASLYLKRKKMGKWESTLQAYMAAADSGMQRAKVADDLARQWMLRGQWEKAMPHAEVAAQTWSNWGLEVGSQAAEALADWDVSEKYIRAKSGSYPSSSGFFWYFWCRRTGRGELKLAQKLATDFFAVPASRPDRTSTINLAVFHLLEGELEESRKTYRKAQKFGASPSCFCMCAQISRELGDDKACARALKYFNDSVNKDKDKEKADSVRLVMLNLANLIYQEEPSPLTEEQLSIIDQGLAKLTKLIDGPSLGFCGYIVGKALVDRGQTGLAEKYFRISLKTPKYDLNYFTLSGFELAKIHGTSRSDEDVREPEDFWKPEKKSSGTPVEEK